MEVDTTNVRIRPLWASPGNNVRALEPSAPPPLALPVVYGMPSTALQLGLGGGWPQENRGPQPRRYIPDLDVYLLDNDAQHMRLSQVSSVGKFARYAGTHGRNSARLPPTSFSGPCFDAQGYAYKTPDTRAPRRGEAADNLNHSLPLPVAALAQGRVRGGNGTVPVVWGSTAIDTRTIDVLTERKRTADRLVSLSANKESLHHPCKKAMVWTPPARVAHAPTLASHLPTPRATNYERNNSEHYPISRRCYGPVMWDSPSHVRVRNAATLYSATTSEMLSSLPVPPDGSQTCAKLFSVRGVAPVPSSVPVVDARASSSAPHVRTESESAGNGVARICWQDERISFGCDTLAPMPRTDSRSVRRDGMGASYADANAGQGCRNIAPGMSVAQSSKETDARSEVRHAERVCRNGKKRNRGRFQKLFAIDSQRRYT